MHKIRIQTQPILRRKNIIFRKVFNFFYNLFLFIFSISILSGCNDLNGNVNLFTNGECIHPDIRNISNLSTNQNSDFAKSVTITEFDNLQWITTNFSTEDLDKDVKEIVLNIHGSVVVADPWGHKKSSCSSEDPLYTTMSRTVNRYVCSCVEDRKNIYYNNIGRYLDQQGFENSNYAPSMEELINTINTVIVPNTSNQQLSFPNQSSDSKNYRSMTVYEAVGKPYSTKHCPNSIGIELQGYPRYYGYCGQLPKNASNQIIQQPSNGNTGNYGYLPLTKDKFFSNEVAIPSGNNEFQNACPPIMPYNYISPSNSQEPYQNGVNLTVFNPGGSNNEVFMNRNRGKAYYIPADGGVDKKGNQTNNHGPEITLGESSSDQCSFSPDWGNNVVLTIANPVDDFGPQNSNNDGPGFAFGTRWTWKNAYTTYVGKNSNSKIYNSSIELPNIPSYQVPHSNPLDHHYCYFNPDCSMTPYKNITIPSSGDNYHFSSIGSSDCLGNQSFSLGKDITNYEVNGKYSSCWNILGRGLSVVAPQNIAGGASEKWIPLEQYQFWVASDENNGAFFPNMTFQDDKTNQIFSLANYYNQLEDKKYSHFISAQADDPNIHQIKVRINNTHMNPDYNNGPFAYGYNTNTASIEGVSIGSASPSTEALQNANSEYVQPMAGGYTVFLKSQGYEYNYKKNYGDGEEPGFNFTGLYGCFASKDFDVKSANCQSSSDINLQKLPFEYVVNNDTNSDDKEYFNPASILDKSAIVSGERAGFCGCPTTIFPIRAGGNQKIPLPTDATNNHLYVAFFDSGNYQNNHGYYTLDIRASSPSTISNSNLSSIIYNILHPIEKIVQKASDAAMYFATCSNGSTKACTTSYSVIIMIALSLYIMIYAMFFMYGMVQITQADLVWRVVKIGFIIGLLSPNFIQYVTTDVLQGVYKASMNLTNFIISNTMGILSNNSNIILSFFSMFDFSISELFSAKIFMQLIAILFTGTTGIVMLIGIILAFYYLLSSLFTLIKVFASAYIFIAILILLSPIFIPFMLFGSTKHLTEQWFKLIIRYSLEPMIIFTGAFIINAMLVVPIISIFDFSICYKCVINLMGSGFLNSYLPSILQIPTDQPLLCIPGYLPWGYDNLDGGAVGIGTQLNSSFPVLMLNDVLVFIILAKLMHDYVNRFGSMITNQLTQTSGRTVNLTNAVGQQDLEGRAQERTISNSLGLNSGIGGLLAGKGFGNNMFSRILGMENTDRGTARRSLYSEHKLDAELDIASEQASGIARFANHEEAHQCAINFSKTVADLTAKQKTIDDLQSEYAKVTGQGIKNKIQGQFKYWNKDRDSEGAELLTKINDAKESYKASYDAVKDSLEDQYSKLTATTNTDYLERDYAKFSKTLFGKVDHTSLRYADQIQDQIKQKYAYIKRH